MASRETAPMKIALLEARKAAARGEVPVGACIRDPATGRILAADGNRTIALRDPTAHAEILAIRAACASLNSVRLTGLDIFVTLEPCPFCAGAIAAARLARVYYGAEDPKGGGVAHGPRIFDAPGSLAQPEIYDSIAASESAALLRDFFAVRRKAK